MAKKSRKVFATTATAALVASAVAPIASSAAGFSDVTKPEYKTAIDALAEAGILNGYENGTFKPENKVTRGEVAKVITLIRHLEEGTKTPFKDVKDGYWSTQYINSLYAAKLVNGYEDGTFKPEGNVTRAEFAKLVVDAYGLTLTNAATPFTDVKAGNWATPYIQTAYANGLIKGVTASKFDPNAAIKRGDLAILLHRADSKFGDVIGNNFPGVQLVKATNNTTVEVTFKDEVDAKNVKAANFSIEGLTVSNAAVKQTDSKTVVLTTSAQEGGKQYTVKSGSATLGKFIGASAVVPSDITVNTKSLQGVIGEEVTLSAQVKVKEGESAAGIPVTFNIQNDSKDNKTIEVEALTNDKGVAEYSYTRYYNGVDNAVAYATKKSTVKDNAKVYWASAKQLTVKDITEATSLTNGSKKVYEINSAANAGKYVFVTFKENLNVAPDKAVKDVKVEGLDTYSIKSNGDVIGVASEAYPYEYTTGGKAVTVVKLDASGKANLVVTGSNAEVTPIVFAADYKQDTAGKFTSINPYSATALQAQASTVKFELKHDLGLTIKAEGVQNAATYKNATETGGRDYTVTYTDKDGKAASPGTKVKVAIDTTGVKGDLHVLDSDGKEISATSKVGATNYYEVKVEKEGKALFTVASTNVNDYVSPVAFIDNGKSTGNGVLDKDDLQAQGEITYFVANVTYSAELVALDKNDVPVKDVLANGTEYAKFVYGLVDQNGKPRSNADATKVSFEVKAGTGTVYVNGTEVKAGTTKTVEATIASNATEASVKVVAQTPSSVTVTATGSRAGVVLPSTNPASVTVNFSQYGTEPVTGVVTSYDTALDVFTINNIVYSYATGTWKYKGSVVTKSAFEGYLAQGNAKVSVTKDADGKFTFDILENVSDASIPVTVTSAVAVDTNADAIADTVEITFSKNVDATTLATSDFKVTNGTVASVVDGTVDDNKISLTITGATGLSLGTLTINGKDSVAKDGAKLASGSFTLSDAVAATGVTGAGVSTPGTAGTKQVETLTTTAATGTGDATVTVAAKGFNGNNPLNITVPVVASDSATDVGTKVYNKLVADTKVTNFFDVTKGATSDEIILTAKTAADDDATMKITLANNVTTATSADTTAGVAPGKESVDITISTGATNAGNVSVTLVDGSYNHSVVTAVAAGDSASTVASKIFAKLINDNSVTSHYDVSISGAVITLVDKTPGVNDTTVVTVK
ncbi:S-layer homology domain-containing protein [Heyndrickxia sp. FSL W8-0496]|jgi:predicted DNA-binding antitoxin AbrB/MazE fold protein|uniref:S-layer homology domain-containing protein n=1 Tax=Heyndrickxia sp. FSL W8-0496 TaxID=2954702 RepID=UPI0030F703C7